MSITALEGPIIVAPDASVVGQPANQNPERGPSLLLQWVGILDNRTNFTYNRGQNFGAKTYGILSGGDFIAVDQVPSAISAVNIATAQVPVAATPLTLVAASGAGITVGQSIVNSSNGQTVSGLLAIDGQSSGLGFGQAATIQIWDPTKSTSRILRYTSVGDDHLATVTARGFDTFWFPISETVTLSNAGIASGKKAFKYVQSITPAGTLSGSNLSVGTGDVFGFPMRVDRFAYADIAWNDGRITSNTGFVAADTTNPATATTGDVRGTYAVQSASDGTKRLQIFIKIPVSNINSVAGLWGVTQA
jgi:hypothetical protein